MDDYNLAKRIYEEIDKQKDKEVVIKGIVDELVDEASKELHEFVKTVDQYLKKLKEESRSSKKVIEYSDQILELQCIKLPVLMYFASDYMETWGLNADIAKAEYQEAYDKSAKKVAEQSGRVSDMELAGREGALVQDWVLKIKSRVYSKLKTRLKYADEIFNGLRKVMSKRITDLEVFRKENANRFGRDYEGVDED